MFDVEAFNAWLIEFPEYATLIIFGIAFIESLAIIGLFMPGWLLLVGVGVLIGTGSINYLYASVACFLGAVIGEALSYYLGRFYHDRIPDWEIIKRHPDWLSKTESFIQRYGVASIAIGRFVGPVRAFAPLISGMASMPPLTFHLTNVLSALVWAPVYLVPGIIVGAAIEINDQDKWLLLLTLSVLTLSVWFAQRSLKESWHEHRGHQLAISLSLILTVFCSYSLIWGPQSELFGQLWWVIWDVIQSSVH